MWNLPSATEVLIAFGTLITGAAAFWGAATAFTGLDRWKNQKVWEDSRQLARDLALNARECSDNFHSLRSPFMSAGEMDAAYADKFEKAIDHFSEKERSEASILALDLRLQRLNEPLQRLYAKLVEADLLWGTSLEDHHSEMRRIINKVISAHELKEMEHDRAARNSYRRTAYGLRDDEIGSQFENLVKAIVSEAAKRLRSPK